MHFGTKFKGWIELVFEYEWEQQNRAKYNYSSVENIVRFFANELPVEVKNRRR